ncbi:hypothetical protein [Nocardia africana]|uniref:TrbL/VirB6 plasmid conjugal transfer protein n=1 Tax=Nocardia africana TaxID=134964 RepID=A0A378X4A8_9NOCA|nr:hypothetical protein [Nocardia africana]MCC3318320.1 hypothetical protein [Nocardia africana]SUA47383.1 Uncharacterised protein [Nocardia africana]
MTTPAIATVTHAQLPDIVCDLPTGPGAVCALKQLGGEAANSAANSAFDSVVDSLIDGMTKALRFDVTWWVNLPSPQLAASTGEPGPALASIRGYTSGLQVLLMIAGILFAAARLAMAKRGGVAGEAQESFLMFARAVFASMMFSALITTGTKAGDAFSNWVINDATGDDLYGAVERLVDNNLRDHSNLGSGVLLVLAVLGLISMLVQLAMLVIRQAVLILVVAAIPLAAAAAGTGPGSQAYKRMLSWALAFVLWKPVGALIYAIAFTAAGTKTAGQQQDPQLVLLGMILLLSVTIVLPALMRLVAPAVATLGGGGGAGAALAGGALGIAMGSAGGDRSAARKMTEGENATSGGGGGGGGPNPSPSGPSGGAGGGRPLSGGTGGGGVSPGRGASPGGASSGGSGSAGTGGRPAGASGQAGGSSGAAGGAGAGIAGAAVMGAQVAGQGVQSASSAVESQAGDGWDVDAPGPLEVRR